MPKLTKRTVESTKPGKKDIWLWDEELRGFGLRVKPSGIKSYLIQYRTVHGATRRFTIGRHGILTTDQARNQAKQLLAEVARGGDPSGSRRAERAAQTMNDLLDRYIEEHVRLHNKPSTIVEVERMVGKYIRPMLGKAKVIGISNSDVMKLHRSMKRTPRQANLVLSVLSKFFNLSEAWGVRPNGNNPCRHVKRYPENKRERFLSEAELSRVGEVMQIMEHEKRLPTVVINAIKLLALTGCRLGEVLTLSWENVNFDCGTLKLPDTKTGARVNIVGAPVLAFLTNLPRNEKSPWVFCGTDVEKPLRKERLEKAWQKIRKEAGIEDVRLHDLRHTVGTYASQTGANAFLVRDKLGHATLAMTDRYVNRDANPLRDLSEKVESRIAAAFDGESAKVVSLKKRS